MKETLWRGMLGLIGRGASLLVFTVGMTGIAFAEGDVPGPNGCGSGWNVWLVPDSLPVLQCNFKPACDQHDRCYGRCEGRKPELGASECSYLRCRPGGDLHQSAECETKIEMVMALTRANQRKISCDGAFRSDILKSNAERAVCKVFAEVYFRAVKQWGGSSFRGVSKTGQVIYQSRTDYDAALREFFRQGTEAQFETAAKALAGEKPALDLKAPIEFDPGRGLVNK